MEWSGELRRMDRGLAKECWKSGMKDHASFLYIFAISSLKRSATLSLRTFIVGVISPFSICNDGYKIFLKKKKNMQESYRERFIENQYRSNLEREARCPA